ncbi:MAG TPA: LacI family DNA-binding transcriptional regulator [Dyella sp.]|uniref:LacI family DNA-binding transcriptional regulator n=1 Tax=Dyella sp. TaxID=1869338 RepID=UPI002D78C762|nr:LacI family DNA-binding transcriptional regulator [Dyella sp.]HET6554740.1 LacI family DNA-binding transcriptional regulator [Dyella sp.]
MRPVERADGAFRNFTATIQVAMRARIEDVARVAGVSPKTVSRVLNDEPNVREDTRLRILQAVRSLDYRPHPSARSLASNRSFLVALLYDNPSPSYMMEVQDGVLEACEAQRYSVMLQPLDATGPRFLEQVEQLISERRLDGLILTPPISDHAPLLRRLRELGTPFACVAPRDRNCAGVVLDERRAACEMVVHLASLGHQRIGHIIGHPDHGASIWRLDGYRDGLAQSGLQYDARLVVQGQFSFDSGVVAARAMLALPLPPTAIFAANDDMAAGVIWAANEAGLAVPRDLSVCGFDDTPLSRQIWPSLTTIHQPCRDMGRIAANQLLRAIRDGEGAMVSAKFALCLRGSTARVPGRPAKEHALGL